MDSVTDAAQAHFGTNFAIGPPIGVAHVHLCAIRQGDGIIIPLHPNPLLYFDGGYFGVLIPQIFRCLQEFQTFECNKTHYGKQHQNILGGGKVFKDMNFEPYAKLTVHTRYMGVKHCNFKGLHGKQSVLLTYLGISKPSSAISKPSNLKAGETVQPTNV